MKKKLIIPVIILLERKQSDILWVDYFYSIKEVRSGIYDVSLLPKVKDNQIYTQLNLVLHEDECVSYYYNLLSESPKLMVACETVDDYDDFGIKPVLITADFDHANAHLEMDSDVYLVDVPKDIYVILEKFVVDNYQNEKRRKRKRT